MEFSKLISERYSVRQFKNEHLSQDVVDKILNAGHLAPTGCNFQPQKILVINTDSSIEKLKDCTRCHFDAPTAFLVCYDKEQSWQRKYDGALSAPVDASIVATHMMLAAHDIGIGCTWVMHFNPAKMREAFNIPESYEPAALLVMGIPHPENQPNKLHFEYKDISENVFYETF